MHCTLTLARFAAVRAGALALALAACSSGGGPAKTDTAGGAGGADAVGTTAKKCSFDKDNAVGLDKKAKLAVRQGSTPVDKDSVTTVNASTASIGGKPLDVGFLIANDQAATGAIELLVQKIDLVAPAGENSFSCIAADDAGKPVLKNGIAVACKDYTWGSIVPQGFEAGCASRDPIAQARFIVRFTKVDNTQKSAKIQIKADGDPDISFFEFTVQTKQGKAAINVAPSFVDFDVAAVGQPPKVKQVAIQNTGEAPLLVSGVQWPLQDKTFSIKIGDKVVTGDKAATFDPPLSIDPGGGIDCDVTFAPVDDKGRKATLQIVSNAAGPAQVQLQGNLNVPCLLVKPEKTLDYNLVYVGVESVKPVVLQNCGDADVQISLAKLSDDSQGVYAFSKDTKLPADGQPLVLAKNAKAILNIGCTPPSENKDAAGKPQPFTAKLNLTDTTAKPNKTIDLTCQGNASKCPTPVIVMDPGEQIEPQTVFKLKGSQSYAAPPAKITKYKWTALKTPPGAVGLHFVPNDTTADVKFGTDGTLNGQPINWLTVAGEYQFKLQVWDDTGTESCAPAISTLLVIPSVGLHVELLWDTPEDDTKDTGNGNGADLDLHFTHPKAMEGQLCSATVTKQCQPDLDKDSKADPWFHEVYDCYWYNPSPKWGSAASANDDPGLDLDDTDGWGPENLNMATPEDGMKYGVGVHYWDSFGYGNSTATVNIYLLGMLKATFTQPMTECDMWWVTQIDWPSGNLVDWGGANLKAPSAGKIVPKYWSNLGLTLGGVCKPK